MDPIELSLDKPLLRRSKLPPLCCDVKELEILVSFAAQDRVLSSTPTVTCVYSDKVNINVFIQDVGIRIHVGSATVDLSGIEGEPRKELYFREHLNDSLGNDVGTLNGRARRSEPAPLIVPVPDLESEIKEVRDTRDNESIRILAKLLERATALGNPLRGTESAVRDKSPMIPETVTQVPIASEVPEEMRRLRRRRRRREEAERHAKDSTRLPLSTFSFEPLTGSIDWKRILVANVGRIQRDGDIQTLRTFLPEVAIGNPAIESLDVVPAHATAFRLAQLSTQYLLHCKTTLEAQKRALDDAVRNVQVELERTKQAAETSTAKARLLRRQARKQDKIIAGYASLLRQHNPALAALHLKETKVSSTKSQESTDSVWKSPSPKTKDKRVRRDPSNSPDIIDLSTAGREDIVTDDVAIEHMEQSSKEVDGADIYAAAQISSPSAATMVPTDNAPLSSIRERHAPPVPVLALSDIPTSDNVVEKERHGRRHIKQDNIRDNRSDDGLENALRGQAERVSPAMKQTENIDTLSSSDESLQPDIAFLSSRSKESSVPQDGRTTARWGGEGGAGIDYGNLAAEMEDSQLDESLSAGEQSMSFGDKMEWL